MLTKPGAAHEFVHSLVSYLLTVSLELSLRATCCEADTDTAVRLPPPEVARALRHRVTNHKPNGFLAASKPVAGRHSRQLQNED